MHQNCNEEEFNQGSIVPNDLLKNAHNRSLDNNAKGSENGPIPIVKQITIPKIAGVSIRLNIW
jgi:hypothetical protein